MLHLIERLGSFLGLAAFFGLAVLALLYFAQARDVRRLRDWAGRAPDAIDSVESAIDPGQVAAVKQREEERLAIEEARKAAQAASAERVARMERRQLGQPDPLSERLRNLLPEPQYLALIVGAVAIIGVGAAVGVNKLAGGGSSTKSSKQGGRTGGVVPGQVEVAVLNGTAIPGLAAKIATSVQENGFKRGPVTNSRSSFSTTIVMYERGHAREAKAVGQAIGVNRTRLINADIRSVAAGSPVAVVVGQDRASL